MSIKSKNLGVCVIYVRVSTEEQKESGHSLYGQEQACRKYVTENGGTVEAIFTDVVSGKAKKRAKLDQAISMAVRESAKLVFWDLDRMGRHEETCHRIKDLLGFSNLVFVSTPYMQELEFSIRVGMAAEELRKLSTRTKMGMAGARQAGKRIGRVLGCRVSEDARSKSIESRKGIAMEVNQLARNVIEVERAKGLSYNKIAQKLTEYKVKSAKGGQWTATQVRRVALLFDLEGVSASKDSKESTQK
jgi:DNA invertase Pin-like site-specific DNA recombinase